ncbi:YcnI family protein [Microbacterium sp. NEAU-LLC]|uniref:YcnI family protein n=1 Tax=Microbacterium helvum TaxID=2773713 RepID=A0ABR8NRX5_9MICO|nr:YcnI family protein [Microbacterium helvum]MBD3943389.1 YcnI family protein [Microbacterium helvum]
MTISRTARRRLAVGAAAGLALALGVPLAAAAHVHVDPETAAAGATQTLTFSFSHGCDGSPTTALAIDIPEGVGNATPVVQGGWTITRELGTNGVPTRVVYTAATPVDDGLKASVAMDVLFTEGAAETSLAFPVTQTCVVGETAWTQIADDDQDPEELDAPAPVVTVGAVSEADSDHHGGKVDAVAEDDATADHHGSAADAAADDDAAAAASTDPGDPLARWLAAGGLLAGVAALIVVLVHVRRSA